MDGYGIGVLGNERFSGINEGVDPGSRGFFVFNPAYG